MDDLAGASRIAPVVYYRRNEPERAVEAARLQAAVTHNEPSVLETSAFFARLALGALAGKSPVLTAGELIGEDFRGGTVEELVRKGLDSAGRDTTEIIAEFGQACSVEKGLPSVMHLIAAYEDDVKEALVASTMAGGDSAARNHAVGMILGGYLGLEGLPDKWIHGLKARARIEELL
jgi:ADP-ribosylglycohydrolase